MMPLKEEDEQQGQYADENAQDDLFMPLVHRVLDTEVPLLITCINSATNAPPRWMACQL